MKKYFAFLIGICFTALLLGTMAGCSDNCTVCPEDKPPIENEYHFLYGYGFYNWVYTYSTKTGQVVDSAKYYGEPFWDVCFSHDGEYAYYTGNSVWITNFPTGDTVAMAQQNGAWVSLSHDQRYLFISGATVLKVFELPSLVLVYQRAHTNSWGHGAVHPLKNIAYVGNNAVDSLLIIDFRTLPARDSMVPLFYGYGPPTPALSGAVSKDGKILILDAGPGVQLRDAETLELLREYPSVGIGPYMHPDGVRVFFLRWQDPDVGQEAEVWELSLKTFLMIRILRGADFLGYSFYYALHPSDMDFTPDGKYAFITNGGAGHYPGSGAIMKLDCDTYKIVDAIYPPGVPQRIRINPKEINAPQAH